MAKILLVRHGESQANAGVATVNPRAIPMTELGHAQAKAFAEKFEHEPTLIVRSSYIRAMETAAHFIERFPNIPVEDWPVHEFTYLKRGEKLLTGKERLPAVLEYWAQCDPDHRDGPVTETFSELVERCRNAIARFEALGPDALVVVFTHGYWMQIFRMCLLFPKASVKELMANARRFDHAHPIRNTHVLEFESGAGGTRPIAQELPAAFELANEPS